MNDAKEDVRAKLAIEDVIGEYVQLKRAGKYWKGLSPFTSEKTPSFYVTPERDIWHDFSSGKGGDIFSFIMEVEGLDFRGALELLAQKAGVDLSMYDSKASRNLSQQKERIYRMNGLAVNYYQHCLTKSTDALDYVFKHRAISKDSVMQWGIGYAPDHPNLKSILLKKGFSDKEIRTAGLVSYRGNEMFRSRMMIPLRDGQGQVVGFTGRIIGQGQPKYLNTPATILYDKGRQLFGLNFAKKTIRDHNFSVVVEGNVDVISSHQAGVTNVVGVAGTALTINHLRSLGRLSSDVRFCFDSDRAGVAATERAIKLAESLNLKLSVIDYSGLGAKDPDELIQEDPTKWNQALGKYKPAVEWVMDRYSDNLDLTSIEGKKTLTTKVLDIVRHLGDAVEQEFYLKKLAISTGVSLEALRRKMLGQPDISDNPAKLKPVKTRRQDYNKRDEAYYLNDIFAIAFKYNQLRPMLSNLPDNYLTGVLIKLKAMLLGANLIDDSGRQVKVAMTPDLADKMSELEIVANNSNYGDERIRLLDSMNNLEKLRIRLEFEKTGEELARAVDKQDDKRISILGGIVAKLKSDLNLIDRSSPRNDYDGLRQLWQQRRSA